MKKIKTPKQMYEHLKNTIRDSVPKSVVNDIELEYKAELAFEVNELINQKNAVVLKHNYMDPILYHAVDGFTGDSLELSRKAATTDAAIIIFCGVNFMAETAKILNPTKTVLIPSLEAGCSLAEGITREQVQMLKRRFPGLPVVSYVNTTAATKAETDVCCTSGNSVQVVEWALKEFKTKSLIFIPDKYMVRNIAKEKNMDVYIPNRDESKDKDIDYKNNPTLIGWDARCYVHEQYTTRNIDEIRESYPDVIILAHPECKPEVIDASDFSGSTSSMVKFVEKYGKDKKIALLTECSMADNLVARFPQYKDNLIRMCNIRCKYMNRITLEDLKQALIKNQYQIEVPDEIRLKALKSVQRMIEIF